MDYEIAATETQILNSTELPDHKPEESQEAAEKPQHLIPASEVESIRQAIQSKPFILISVMSFVLMNGFLVMSCYKLLTQRYSSGEDNITTLFACLGFILFGTARYTVREIIIKLGFKRVFLMIGLFQLVSFVLLYFHTHTGITIGFCIYIQGLYLNWFNLLIPKVFGYRHAAKLIQIMLIVFAVENIFIHILNHYLDISILVKASGIMFTLAMVAFGFFKDRVEWGRDIQRNQ